MEQNFGPGTVFILGPSATAILFLGDDERSHVQVKGGITIHHPGSLGLEQTLLVNRSWRTTGKLILPSGTL